MFDMPKSGKEAAYSKILGSEDDGKRSEVKIRKLKAESKSKSLLCKRKVSSCIGEENGNDGLKKKKKKIVEKASVHRFETSKKQPSSSDHKDKNAAISTKESVKSDERNVKRRRRNKGKHNVEVDEASRLQRRTRYLLIKVKLEQNFVDAYSAEGWKGQSREKIKPEQELQRAKKQILECKLGIRDVVRQLDSLSSVGRIDRSVVAPDGSVHHEHIICAKCNLREALPDNDIILCDGTCNRAFHQKCLDPPLLTENIPPDDEGWFCKFCKKKIEILEATNAHLGTHFPLDSDWQDIFKEEAALADGGTAMLCPEEEWPSDDSEDDDYDPVESSYDDRISCSMPDSSDCSSSSLGSLEDETLLTLGVEDREDGSFSNSPELIGIDSDEINGEVLCGPRQRAAVNYIKLHDEMFGKNASENEQMSDEDWGPTKRKRKVKETDAAGTLTTVGERKENGLEESPSRGKEKLSIKKKRPIFRLPHDAVEKLRLAFAENELPDRSLRESLSEQLGIEFEKVNKWFKNARYLALKARKAEIPCEKVSPSIQNESTSNTEKEDNANLMTSKEITVSYSPEGLKKFVRRRNMLANSSKMKQQKKPSSQISDGIKTSGDLGDVSLKHLMEEAKAAKKKLNSKKRAELSEAETQMKRLCEINTRVRKLRQVLLELPSPRIGIARKTKIDSSNMYVPIAEVKENR